MDVQVTIASERVDPVIVSFYGDGEERITAIGQQIYDKPGTFTYKWLLDWMNPHEVAELIAGLKFALDYKAPSGD